MLVTLFICNYLIMGHTVTVFWGIWFASEASPRLLPLTIKEFSQTNEGKSCYLFLVQIRHDGLKYELKGKLSAHLSALNQA